METPVELVLNSKYVSAAGAAAVAQFTRLHEPSPETPLKPAGKVGLMSAEPYAAVPEPTVGTKSFALKFH